MCIVSSGDLKQALEEEKQQKLQSIKELGAASRTVGLLSKNQYSLFSTIPTELSRNILGFLPATNLSQNEKRNTVDREFKKGIKK